MTVHSPVLTFEEIRGNWLFQALSDEHLQQIIDGAEYHHLKRGELLFQQGDVCKRFYLMRKGQMKLYRLSAEGEEKVIDLANPGQTFAEAVAFMEGNRFPVSSEAVNDVELVGIDSQVFMKILSGSVELGFRVMGVMSKRMHQLLMEVDELTLHNATYRLVNFLLHRVSETNDGRVVLDVPKYVIASRLSIKPETLSRIFNRLKKDGLIQVEGETLCVLDEDALRQKLE